MKTVQEKKASKVMLLRISEDVPADLRIVEGERGGEKYRDVKVEVPDGHEMLGRIVRLWNNIEIVVPAALLSEDRDRTTGEGMFDILNREGGRRVQWFKNNLASISEARGLFNELVGQGLVPHRVDGSGQETAEIMKSFDPAAEEVVFSSPRAFVGG